MEDRIVNIYRVYGFSWPVRLKLSTGCQTTPKKKIIGLGQISEGQVGKKWKINKRDCPSIYHTWVSPLWVPQNCEWIPSVADECLLSFDRYLSQDAVISESLAIFDQGAACVLFDGVGSTRLRQTPVLRVSCPLVQCQRAYWHHPSHIWTMSF